MEQADTHTPKERPWLLLAAVLAGFFALGGLTMLLPHDPYARYQQLDGTLHFRSVWSYERVAFDETPIDIAIIGNSRLQSAVAAPVVQEELSKQLGREVRVANLSLPQEGRNAHYAMARQLFEHHPEVELVILSAIEAMPRDGHPAFRNIADPGDVIGAPALINRDYGEDLAFIPFRQMSLALQSWFPELFGIRSFDEASYWGSDYDTTLSYESPTGGSIDKDSIYSAELLRPYAEERIRSITPPVLPAGFADQEFAIERYYTQAIADLAHDNGAQVAFLYMPVFEHPVPLREGEFYRNLGRVLTADCIAADASKYSDYGHLNTPGAHKVSRMLGDTLARIGWDSAQAGEDEVSLCP